MKSLFVTATGTDIGKTFVTCRLAETLIATGKTVTIQKPVISGFDPDNPADSDTGEILKSLGQSPAADTIEKISPWRFRDPISPDIAAAREGREIDFEALVSFCRAPAPADFHLIEGVGGVRVPLTEKKTTLDLMVALDFPVLLVAGSYLGTISHTLTALGSLNQAGLTPLAIIVSESEEQPVRLAETVEVIQRFSDSVPVFPWPRDELDGPAAALASGLGLLV